MGQHAGADLAWGVVISDEDGEGYHASLGGDFDTWEVNLEEILGFTEEAPWELPGYDGLDRKVAEECRNAYLERKDAAVLVDFEFTGSDYWSLQRLIIKRSHVDIYECGEIEEVTEEHFRPPTSEESAQLNTVLDHIGFTGDRTPKFLLATSYG